MVTIKELAQILGVSRGTVDRVLHNRGKVSPEIREQVLAKAKELNYQPNKAGIMLSLRKQPKKIGALVPSIGNPFFESLITGMMKATDEYSDLGFSLSLKEVKGFDRIEHLAAIRKLVEMEDCDALLLATIDDETIIDYLQSVRLPVIAVNSDIALPRKLCYVGPDYYAKGALHAGLLDLTGAEGRRILILKGSEAMRGHSDMIRGFKETIDRKKLKCTIAGIYDTYDDNETAERIVRDKLAQDSTINTMFITTAGVRGAVKGAGEHKLLIFSSDDIQETKDLIKEGKIRWTICQEPFRQGFEAVRRMQSWFIDGTEPENLFTQHVIKLVENIET